MADINTPDGKLTAKQARFVDEYLKDLNGTQAAIRAGYSLRTANRIATENLSKPVIAEAIGRRRKVISEKLQVTQERIIGGLVVIAEDLNQPGATRVSAWAQVAKILGYAVNRTHLSGNFTHHIADSPLQPLISSLSDEELEAIACGRATIGQVIDGTVAVIADEVTDDDDDEFALPEPAV